MSKRKAVLMAAGILLALAFFAGGMIWLARGTVGADGLPQTPIKMNEIMTNNDSYPNADGVIADWIELVNSGESDVDISGYMLTDRMKTIRWAFPEGTVIPAGGYLLVTCDEGEGEALYSGFSMAKSGKEAITLLSPNHTVIDRVVTSEMKKDTVLARNSQGSWEITDAATPGRENSEAGRAAYLSSLFGGSNALVITEIMSQNLSVLADGNGAFSDWIEITNQSGASVSLRDCGLSDDPSKPLKWQFPDLELQGGQSLLVFASSKDEGDEDLHAGFGISGKGETITLSLPSGIVIDRVDVPALEKNQAWQRQENGEFAAVMGGTPGSDATGAFSGALEGKIQISEVMAANTAGIRDEQGQFCDWIELENLTDTDLKLTDCWLSRDSLDPYDYRLPDITLKAGEYLLLYASTGDGGLFTGFSLSSSGGTLILTSPQGALLDSFTYGKAEDDQAMLRQAPGDDPIASYEATPGRSNTQAGYLELLSQGKAPEGLIISEVMTSNSRYLPQSGGKYTDWVELYNAGEEEIDLSAYRLTDDLTRDGLTLPQETLKPGQYKMIFCAGEKAVQDGVHADFKLNDQVDRIYLCRGGELCDWMFLYQISPNQSFGRIIGEDGFFYFAEPSPMAVNRNGTRGISRAPQIDQAEGVYAKGSTLTVHLSGEGTLYYTTGGTVPTTRSTVYTEPIEICENTILRVMMQEENCLPSEIVTRSYIFADHQLPVMCINADPNDLFGTNGIYTTENSTRNMEKACNLTFLDEACGFNADCGVKLHGATSRTNCSKKSFRMAFRKQYGPNELFCPGLFEDNELESFKSLVLRAGQDGAHTMMREELFSILADELNPNLLAVDTRYVVLYVNGEYWGIYSLKEQQDGQTYANHACVSSDSVQVYEDFQYLTGGFKEVLDGTMSRNVSDADVYAYLEEHIDFLNLIDWGIFQVYSANTDISGNVRYFYSSEGDHKLRYGLFDFDLTCRNTEGQSFYNVLSSGREWGALPARLLQNPQFKKLYCQRAAYAAATVLSEKHVLEKIDELAAQIESEVPNDSARWYRGDNHWAEEMEILRNFVRSGRTEYLLTDLAKRLRIDKADMEEYFPDHAENLVFH